MPSLKINITANFVGSIWSALMGIAFVPLYIKFMGIESFGLVGFFGTLLWFFSILDMGLSATLNRELARRSTSASNKKESADLLKTLEVIYWSIAILVGVCVIILSYPIARYWINPNKLSINDVQVSIMIMGLVMVMRWPFGLYQGGLMGLQRQVLVNKITVVSNTLRGLGATLVLWLVAPTIQAFFCWQIVISGFETFVMAFFLWHSLTYARKETRFKLKLVREIWGFATGIIGINFVAMINSQADKIILSKMLTLEMYGFYMLACTAAASLGKLVSPIFGAIYPRFTQLAEKRDALELTGLYHRSCQLVSIMILPLSVVLVLFSYEVLLLWTSNSAIAGQTHLVFSILVIGTACSVMTSIPYGLQLAYGWTSLTFWLNSVEVAILVPLMIWMVYYYGMIGGAIFWSLLNIAHVLIYLPLMHTRLLKNQLLSWYLYDVAPPFIASLIPALIGKLAFYDYGSKLVTLMYLATVYCVSLLFAALTISEIRSLINNLMSKLQKKNHELPNL